MLNYRSAVPTAALMILAAASCCAGERTLVSIHSSAYFAFSNVRFAVTDATGQTVWTGPASTDWGSFGVYAANNDPIDTTIPGNPGGKMRTNPEGPGWPYYTYGPHYTGPFWVDSFAAASGVGPEYLGHWVGFRLGSSIYDLTGLRFDVTCYYNPAEFRLEVWSVDPSCLLAQSMVAALAPPAGTASAHEFVLTGYPAVELRLVIGEVPEPSCLASLASGVPVLLVRFLRRRR